MCNLYSITGNVEAVRKLFRVPHNRSVNFDPLPAIFPGHTATVIRPTADDEREMVTMSWGFVLSQPGKAPRRVTNTRDDKVLESRFWTPSFRERRCLVLASSFCEPHDGRKPATWHWFALNGDEPRPFFAFAGIWPGWSWGEVELRTRSTDEAMYRFDTPWDRRPPHRRGSHHRYPF